MSTNQQEGAGTPTPRTDGMEIVIAGESPVMGNRYRIWADFARQLERELAKSRDDYAALCRVNSELADKSIETLTALTTARQEVETWMTRCIHAEEAGKEMIYWAARMSELHAQMSKGPTAGEDGDKFRHYASAYATTLRHAQNNFRSAHPSKEDEEKP